MSRRDGRLPWTGLESVERTTSSFPIGSDVGTWPSPSVGDNARAGHTGQPPHSLSPALPTGLAPGDLKGLPGGKEAPVGRKGTPEGKHSSLGQPGSRPVSGAEAESELSLRCPQDTSRGGFSGALPEKLQSPGLAWVGRWAPPPSSCRRSPYPWHEKPPGRLPSAVPGPRGSPAASAALCPRERGSRFLPSTQ